MIVDLSIKQQFVSKALITDLLLLVLKLPLYKFFYEHEKFHVNDEQNLEYVFVVVLPYIMLDFRLMKIYDSLQIILSNIFQNTVTKQLDENQFETHHRRRMKIELVLKRIIKTLNNKRSYKKLIKFACKFEPTTFKKYYI